MASESTERGWVWWLCGLAALRVFILSAAFPFFNNVDEEMHFDAVLKYSRAEFPHGTSLVSSNAAHDIVIYGSPEYLSSAQDLASVPPPVWTQNLARIQNSLRLDMEVWQTKTNYESSSPPLYYVLAGAWLKAGQMAGMRSESRLYWIRFLNVLVVAVLVWLGFLAARATFPGNHFMCLGVPAVLAFLPQDIFYSIQSDVLSPLCFGAAFLGLVRWLRTERPDAKLAALTGLALAVGCLVKTSNLPLFAVGVGTALLCVWQTAKKNGWRAVWPLLAWFLMCALTPILLELVWNWRLHGDIAGADAKAAALGWTRKPFADWWSHPIFTPGGLWTFWRGLMVTFWRGEFIWRGLPMSRPAVDAFYCLSSTLLPGLALASLVPRWAGGLTTQRTQRQVIGLCAASVGASVLFLGTLSVVFDFGSCPYPSRAYPYFASGRLLSGALIPFLLLYLRGLDWGLRKQSPRSKWLVLAGIILLMIISEVVVTLPVFSSQYNWFHLWSAAK